MVLADKPQQALAAALRCRPLIYEQIAILMGVSRDRVRQLEMRAAANLRRPSRFRQLCRFMPGWQNALRLRPEDKMSLLPGETLPFEFGRKRKAQALQKLASPKKQISNNGSSAPKRKKTLSSAKH